jgi:hypothetical protein
MMRKQWQKMKTVIIPSKLAWKWPSLEKVTGVSYIGQFDIFAI